MQSEVEGSVDRLQKRKGHDRRKRVESKELRDPKVEWSNLTIERIWKAMEGPLMVKDVECFRSLEACIPSL